MKYFGIYVLCLILPLSAGAIETTIKGDFRSGYFSKDDSKKGEAAEVRFRLRAGIKTTINQHLSAQLRLAGRAFAWGENDIGFDYLDETPAYSDSIPAGQTTIDTLFFKYALAKNSFVRLGRFQSKNELMGVAKKSLDRNNSPNTDITWTDGLHLSTDLWGSHRLKAIIQYNPENGTTVLRKPLSFLENKSRVSYFLGIQHTKSAGPFVQREIDLTIMPNALCKNGVDSSNDFACKSGNATTYVAAVVRVATQWALMDSGFKFLLGTELGYTPTKPKESAIGGTSAGDADGLAYQLTFNFINFFPKHNIGLVYGRAGGGWLISPDFSSNNTLKEIRYAWKFSKKQKFEFRVRQRDSIVGADRSRKDLYLRYTIKY